MDRRSREPVVLGRPDHNISRTDIDPDALWILRKLRREGFKAYLVGGAVRDLLLGRVPKDFDIGTDAHPSKIRSMFSSSRTIGRRFRIIHVYFRKRGEAEKIIEVSTFRSTRLRTEEDVVKPEDLDQSGSAFGTPEEDAWRRDFTVNALFYNIEDFALIDHTGGLADLEKRVIRLIGEPDERFKEDPVRMLRAIEFAVRLDFEIDTVTREGIRQNAHLISEASPARLREELRQMHQRSITGEVLSVAADLGLFEHLFPDIAPDPVLFDLLKRVDRAPAFQGTGSEYAYIAALALPMAHREAPVEGSTSLDKAHDAAFLPVGSICEHYQISAHIRHLAREMILSCYRLSRGRAYKAKGKFSRKAEFACSLDFYRSWVEASGADTQHLDYWTAYVADRDKEKSGQGTKRRRNRRPRRRSGVSAPVTPPEA